MTSWQTDCRMRRLLDYRQNLPFKLYDFTNGLIDFESP